MHVTRDMKSTSLLQSWIWSSKKQEIVAQSSDEAEFIVSTTAINRVLWLRKKLSDLNLSRKKIAMIIVDNKVVITISHNLGFHEKLELFLLKKSAKGWYYKSCVLQSRRANSLYLTKSLPANKFEILKMKLSVYSL